VHPTMAERDGCAWVLRGEVTRLKFSMRVERVAMESRGEEGRSTAALVMTGAQRPALRGRVVVDKSGRMG
jgi:hypothetical protein